MSAQPEVSTSAVPPTAPSAPLTRSEEVNTFDSPNLLGTLGAFARLGIPANGRFMHPLAPEPPTPSSVPPVAIGQIPNDNQSTLDLAKRFISLLPDISYSLNTASTYPINDARVLSLYKEGSQQEHITLKSSATALHAYHTLMKFHEPSRASNAFTSSLFGADVPLARPELATYVLNNLEQWAKLCGMQFFQDDNSAPGRSAVSLTGKIILVDFEFARPTVVKVPTESTPAPFTPRTPAPIDWETAAAKSSDAPISLVSAKVSIGEEEPGQHPDARHSEEVLRVLGQLGTPNLLLFEKMAKYVALLCDVALEEIDGREVETAAGECIAVLRGLVTLDELAASENGEMGESHEGQRWLQETRLAGGEVLNLAQMEAKVVASDVSESVAPLDILLLRGHPLPFPFMDSVSLSFLVHLPARAYLTILRSAAHKAEMLTDSDFDITPTTLRSLLRHRHARHALAIVCASLQYQPSQTQGPVDESMKLPPFLSMFPGIPSDIPQHFFPQTTSRNGKWVLEWDTGEGEGRSMIMSHSRMARIALALGHSSLVGPGSAMQDVLAGDEAAPGPGLGSVIGPSWVDLLFDPNGMQRHRTFSSTHDRRNEGQEILLNTLQNTNEHGLALGPVEVENLHEVLAVLEVVKEQAWFNDIILRLGHFNPAPMEHNLLNPDLSYDMLQNTTYAPSQLRVSYSLVSDPEGRPGLRLQFGRPPLPAPSMDVEEETLPGLEHILPDGSIIPDDSRPVVVSVVLDSSACRGVRVEVDERRVERFEEVVRRGGIVTLPLKVREWLAESYASV